MRECGLLSSPEPSPGTRPCPFTPCPYVPASPLILRKNRANMRRIAQIISAKFGQAAEELDFYSHARPSSHFLHSDTPWCINSHHGKCKDRSFHFPWWLLVCQGQLSGSLFSAFPIGWPLVCWLEPPRRSQLVLFNHSFT